MAKQNTPPTTIKLVEVANGNIKELEIDHAARFLILMAKQNLLKDFKLPEGYSFDGTDIVKNNSTPVTPAV